MDEAVLDRLTLVTLFSGKGIERYVSAYADVKARMPGLSYERPIAQVEDIVSNVVSFACIKPFAHATSEEIEALK